MAFGAVLQFSPEMFQFKPELSFCHLDDGRQRHRSDLPGIKPVPASQRFFVNAPKVTLDSRHGIDLCLKPFQLGVSGVAAGLSLQDGPRQEALPPKGDEALGIKVAGMKTP